MRFCSHRDDRWAFSTLMALQGSAGVEDGRHNTAAFLCKSLRLAGDAPAFSELLKHIAGGIPHR